MESKMFGRLGEETAARYLQNKGFAIWTRNFRCQAGEIDIVASKDGVIKFVEVKTRQNFNYGRPIESVTSDKQRRIRKCGEYYLKIMERKGYKPLTVEFDVIEVTVRHTENAF